MSEKLNFEKNIARKQAKEQENKSQSLEENLRIFQEALERLNEFHKTIGESEEKLLDFNERYTALEYDRKKLEAEIEFLSISNKEENNEKLIENLAKRDEILDRIKSLLNEYREFNTKIEKATSEFHLF